MKILSVPHVERILNTIYTDYSIAYVGRYFSNAFLRWNELFCEEVTKAISSRLTSFIGRSCNLDIDYSIDATGVLMATILRCNINMKLLRSIERQSNAERIQRGLRSVPPTSFSSVPPVNVAKSPRFVWTPPKRKSFVLPPKTRILEGEYYNGMKVGYYNRKYTILNADGKPITNEWFNNKPRFFKQPFGQYRIIAHVNYCGSLFAVSVDGQLYDMNRLWNDVYLREIYEAIIKSLITETINDYLRKNLLLAS